MVWERKAPAQLHSARGGVPVGAALQTPCTRSFHWSCRFLPPLQISSDSTQLSLRIKEQEEK